MSLSIEENVSLRELTTLKVGGEVINCDSVQIYSGIQIATAKPSEEEALYDLGKECLQRISTAIQALDQAVPVAHVGGPNPAGQRVALASAIRQYQRAIVSAVLSG